MTDLLTAQPRSRGPMRSGMHAFGSCTIRRTWALQAQETGALISRRENGSRCSTVMTGGVRRSWKNSLRSLCTADQGCCIRLTRSLRMQSGRCVSTAFRSRWITAGCSAKMSSAALPYCFTGRCWSGFASARTCSMRTMHCGWRSCAAGTLLPVVLRCWLTGAFQSSQDRLTNAPRP